MDSPIKENTKIRILSEDHARYIQGLAEEAGFSPYRRDMTPNRQWVYFHPDMKFTTNESHAPGPEEIFIDLPTEAELEWAASDMLNDSNDLLDKSGAEKVIDNIIAGQKHDTDKHSHYFKDVSGLDAVDVYRVCDLFEVNDASGSTQHAIKKLLCSGQRGVKGYKKDLEEARDTIQRKLNMMEES